MASDRTEATLVLQDGRVELAFDGLHGTGAMGSVAKGRIKAAIKNR